MHPRAWCAVSSGMFKSGYFTSQFRRGQIPETSRAKNWKLKKMQRIADTHTPPVCIDAILGTSQGSERNTENTKNVQKESELL